MAARILIVDDDRADRMFIRSAFHEFFEPDEIVIVDSGPEALAYLNNDPHPMLIITDFSMPEMSGLELLHNIKAAPALRDIPAIVLSGSDRVQHVAESLEEIANAFVPKPDSREGYRKIALNIRRAWFDETFEASQVSDDDDAVNRPRDEAGQTSAKARLRLVVDNLNA